MATDVSYSTYGIVVRPEIKMIIDDRVKNINLLGNIILPPKMEEDPFGQCYKIRKDNDGGNGVPTQRAVGGGFNRVEVAVSDDSWSTSLDGIEADLPIEQLILTSKARLPIETLKAQVATETWLATLEKRVIGSVFNTSGYSGVSMTSAMTAKLDSGTCDLRKELQVANTAFKAKHKMRLKDLTLLCNEDSFFYIFELYKKSGAASVVDVNGLTEEQQINAVRVWLGVKNIRVGYTSYTSAGLVNIAEGSSFTDIYPSTMLLLYYESQGGDTWGPGLGRQPVFKNWTDSYLINTYPDQSRLSNIIRASSWQGIKMNYQYGYLLTGAL